MTNFTFVLGMSLVTYIPKIVPQLFGTGNYSKFLKRMLKLIPYTALATLVFPDIINSTGNPISAFLGSIVAIITSYLDLHVLLVISSSIMTVVLFNIFF